jgi:hypothetical protein
MTAEVTKERIFDYTTLDTFLQCRRKYYYMMVRHLRSKTTAPALEFGNCMHQALAEYYRSGLEASLAKWRETYRDREGEELRTVYNGEKMLRGYAQVYMNEPFKVVEVGGKKAIEIGFVVPVGNILYAGRLDTLVDWNGDLCVLEHKTSGYLYAANYFKQFNPNLQIDGYIYGAEAYAGRKCFGAVVNAIEVWKDLKRPTEKSKKLEDHYARNPENRSAPQLADFAKQVQAIVIDITNCEQAGTSLGKDAYYQNKHQCMSYNYACPYKDLCMYGENERIIESNFKKEEWLPYKEGEDVSG